MAMGYLGDPANGIPLIEQGLAVWEMMGAILVTPLMTGWYVETLHLNGDLEKALAAADKGIAQARDIHELSSEIYLHRLRGEVLAKMNNFSEAEGSIRESLRLARAQQARSMELKALASLITILTDSSQKKAVLDDLKSTLSFYPDDLDKPFLRRIRALANSQ
jgi:tetratricopeptide (TPR) repeat protein